MKCKSLLCAFSAIMLFAGCSDTDETKPIAVSGVDLNEKILALIVGETSQLSATVTPEDAEYESVIWSSDKPEIATVGEEGLVTAVAAGTATITATAGQKTASCAVTVREKITTVHATGYFDQVMLGFYWKSGMDQLQTLGDESIETYSIFASGEDVYIGGKSTTDEQGYLAATLWKNGVPTYLTDITTPIDAAVNSVYIEGSNIYAGGFYRVPRNPETPFKRDVATIWKNGTQIELTDGSVYAQVKGICVSGGTVYAVGEATNKDGIAIATCWSNSSGDWSGKTVRSLSDGTNHAYAQSVCVSGKDVYAVGYGYRAGLSQYAPLLWKNDEPVQYLSEGGGWAYSVCAANGHIYVAGWEFKMYNGRECAVATLWTDGVPTSLSTEQKSSQARSVFVSGEDIYVSGFLGNVAVIWKNGVPSSFSDGTYAAAITSVFVTQE